MSNNTNNAVLNTVAATAGDITLAARKLNVAITSSTGSGAFPTMDYRYIENIRIQPSLVETLKVSTITFSAAANTDYAFSITQTDTATGVPVTVVSRYTSDSTGAAADIAIGLKSTITANADVLGVTISGASTTLTITAVTGTPLYTVTAIENTTYALSMAGVSIASCTGADPTVCTTGSNHGLVTGNVITITSADEAKLASGTYRVDYESATTFKLQNLVTGDYIAATATTTATVVKRAQVAQGQGADLTDVTGAASGTCYSQYIFSYAVPGAAQMGNATATAQPEFTLYVAEGTTTTSPTTNFGNFDVRMREVANNYAAGGTDADPESLAIAAISGN